MREEKTLLTPLQSAFNDGVEATKAVIRETDIGDYRDSDYWRASLINAIARKVNPYSYGANVPDCDCEHPSHKLNHLTPIES